MRKDYMTVLKVKKRFESNFYLQFYIQHNKTVFFKTIISLTEIIYKIWLYLTSWI